MYQICKLVDSRWNSSGGGGGGRMVKNSLKQPISFLDQIKIIILILVKESF